MHAIGRILEKLYENFYSGSFTHGVFLDFLTAFNTIAHDILSNKLGFYNFSKGDFSLLKLMLSLHPLNM